MKSLVFGSRWNVCWVCAEHVLVKIVTRVRTPQRLASVPCQCPESSKEPVMSSWGTRVHLPCKHDLACPPQPLNGHQIPRVIQGGPGRHGVSLQTVNPRGHQTTAGLAVQRWMSHVRPLTQGQESLPCQCDSRRQVKHCFG